MRFGHRLRVSPLRIALVHPYSWPEVRRGGERYLADLAAHLAGAGHIVQIVTGTSGSPRTDHVDGVAVRRSRQLEHPWLRRRGFGPVETFGLVALRNLVGHRYDVVHALTPTAALAGKLSGHRTLYTVLGQPDQAHFADHPMERRVTAMAIRGVSEVAALSQAAADVEHDVFGRRPIVLPPGVRMERFSPDLRPRTGPPRILFPADASDRRKHVDLALGAMEVVLGRHPDARLLLGGPGDHTWAVPGLGEASQRIMSATDVLGVGRVDDVARRYREATVTVLPSTGEAFGLGVLESLACGTPVVCLPGSGPEEIIAGRAVGRVAPGANGVALGEALNIAIDLARDRGTPGRCVDHARSWDWSRVGPEHLRVYRRLSRFPARQSP